MKQVTLNFREVAVDGLPEKSGDYAVIQAFPISDQANDLHFSAVHGMWNTYDYTTREDAEKTAIGTCDETRHGEITHWIPRAEIESAIKEDSTNAD